MTYEEWIKQFYKPIESIVDWQKVCDEKARQARENWLQNK